MSWVLIGVAALVAWKIVQGKKPAPVSPVASSVADPFNDAHENALQMKAKAKELEILSEIQAKLNLQAKLDRLTRANSEANPSKPSVPNG